MNLLVWVLKSPSWVSLASGKAGSWGWNVSACLGWASSCISYFSWQDISPYMFLFSCWSLRGKRAVVFLNNSNIIIVECDWLSWQPLSNPCGQRNVYDWLPCSPRNQSLHQWDRRFLAIVMCREGKGSSRQVGYRNRGNNTVSFAYLAMGGNYEVCKFSQGKIVPEILSERSERLDAVC